MIKMSITSITNKQRDKCTSTWVLHDPLPQEREKDRKRGITSTVHVNHLPVMENESVIIQLTIKCIANINDKVPIEFSWVA